MSDMSMLNGIVGVQLTVREARSALPDAPVVEDRAAGRRRPWPRLRAWRGRRRQLSGLARGARREETRMGRFRATAGVDGAEG